MILQAGCDQAFWHFWHRIFIIEALPNPWTSNFFPSFFPELPRTSQFLSQVPWQKLPHLPRFFGHGQDLNRPSLERRHLCHLGLGQRVGGPVAVPSGGGAAGSHGGVCLQPADAVNQRAWLVVWKIWIILDYFPYFLYGINHQPFFFINHHPQLGWWSNQVLFESLGLTWAKGERLPWP